MNLPPPLGHVSPVELRGALAAIENGGPYPRSIVRTIRYLGAFGYARVQVNERRRESGEIVTDIVSAQITERGADLLRDLDA
jgi:hypothetical protein